jgi:hypothetical protein
MSPINKPRGQWYALAILPIESYPDQLEPENTDAVIWRFLNMYKFRDLMATSELYFCRTDLLSDKREGLPPEEYLATFGLNPFDLNDRRELLNHIGSDAQFREGFYANCWHLFREETCRMWKEYGNEGVAITSRYQLLKSALDTLSDRAFIGLVRYSANNMLGKPANQFRYITTKRSEYAHEQEVRAFLWIPDQFAGINRHYDENNRVHPRPLTPPPAYVPDFQRRKVDVQTLVVDIVVSPYASPATLDEVKQLVSNAGHKIPVRESGLARFTAFLL